MQLHIYPDADTTVAAMAGFFIGVANKAIEEKGVCNIVLSGGNTPRKLYELLASPAYRDKLNWTKMYFFFGDERDVLPDHPDYNGKMAREALLGPLYIPAHHAFYIDTTHGPKQAAKAYDSLIRSYFGNNDPQFDLVLLGLGDNAHTASLFPHTAILENNSSLVSEVYVEELKTHRISMTARLINQASAIAFLVYGQSKAEAVRNVIEGIGSYSESPAQLINPISGELHWYLDEAAASKLKRKSILRD
ncbi:MAG: 6-phosphogluconolactonase [Chitinophagaceae bacterium]